MLDWKKYFQLSSTIEPYRSNRDELKKQIEYNLRQRPYTRAAHTNMERPIEAMREMHPDKIFVIAESYHVVKSFAGLMRKNPRNVIFISNPDVMQGLDGATVVYLGYWDRNSNNREIDRYMSVRHRIDKWYIQEW